MVSKLLPLIPLHYTYVEVFGGGASLLFAKAPSPVEVYNDIDGGLVNFFRVLRDPRQFKKFYQLVQLTPYSRAEYRYCQESWQDQDDPIERAYQWYVLARMSFSGQFGGGWSAAITSSGRGNMAKTCARWLGIIELLPEIHQRIMRVQIECQDWRNILDVYDTLGTSFYLDPPYIPEVRIGGKRYTHEMSQEDHVELVTKLLAIQGKCMLRGYAHSIYSPLEKAGWERKDWPTVCYAAAKTKATGILGPGAALKMQPRIASIWLSPGAIIQPKLFNVLEEQNEVDS